MGKRHQPRPTLRPQTTKKETTILSNTNFFTTGTQHNKPTHSLDQKLRELLIGQKVTKADDGTLTLDNGVILELYESDQDCCAHAYGTWKITNPNNLEAGITDITYEYNAEEHSDESQTNTLTISLLHNQNPIAQAHCWADDGNGGYYFSVLSMRVAIKGQENNPDIFQVLEA